MLIAVPANTVTTVLAATAPMAQLVLLVPPRHPKGMVTVVVSAHRTALAVTENTAITARAAAVRMAPCVGGVVPRINSGRTAHVVNVW